MDDTNTTPAAAPSSPATTPATAPATAPAAAPRHFAADEVFRADRDGVFDASRYTFGSRPYRVHFRNGNSGEYSGDALCYQFPFPGEEITSVEPIATPEEIAAK